MRLQLQRWTLHILNRAGIAPSSLSFFVVCLTTLSVAKFYSSNATMMMNYDMERIWKEAAVS
jgi:hypothetical protein